MNSLMLVMTLLVCGRLSWWITGRYLIYAQRREIVDIPNQRSSHSTPTPRGGGISFVAVFLLASAVLGATGSLSLLQTAGLLCGGLIGLAGYWDDCAVLAIRYRLLFQIAGVSGALLCFNVSSLIPPILPHTVMQLLWVGMVFAMVWLINLVNFMDGIDGIAGTEACSVAMVCAMVILYRHGAGAVSVLFGVLAVSVLSFLRFNWPPAQIFMGDVGSGFLGYCFGALSLLAAGQHLLPLWTPLIMLGVFVVDATFTLLRRMARGERWHAAHRTHAFQHLAAHIGHRDTTLAAAFVNLAWLAPWAILADLYPASGALCLFASWLPLVAAVHLLGAGEPHGDMARLAAISQLVRQLRAHFHAFRRAKSVRLQQTVMAVARPMERRAAPAQLLLLAVLNFGCVYLAFFTRFDGSVPHTRLMSLPVPAVVWALAETLVLLAFRVHRSHWQYTSAAELPRIVGMSVMSSVTGSLVVATVYPGLVPRSIYFLNAIYAAAAFGAARLLSRFVYETIRGHALVSEEKRVLIYGADMNGAGILSELRRHCLDYRAVGFIDDRREVQGISVCGAIVLGTRADIGKLVKKHRIDQLLLPSHALSSESGRSIVQSCIQEQLEFRFVTPIDEEMRQNRRLIRDVAIEDLLGRPEITLDTSLISAKLQGRVVMVTGAAGSIGSELCRQIARFSPSKIIGYEISETALFFVEREIQERFPGVPFVPCVGSVQNFQRLCDVIATHRPDVVYHAAAYKHVPMMEQHIFEAIENNIFGTATLLRACELHGVCSFVMISTDKAVRPTSLMGVSKRVAEMLVRASCSSQITCVSTRFGNVLGSNGSVIPLFREQIARGGPVKVTHPDMVRFFMTIPEAAQLVIQASTLGSNNEIFVLDMGAPVRIVHLAERLIRLMGLVPGKDIGIEFTGMRPGEKLYEEINMSWEETSPTPHEKISVFRDTGNTSQDLRADLHALHTACVHRDAARALAMLRELVPDYTPSHEIKTMVGWHERQVQADAVHSVLAIEQGA